MKKKVIKKIINNVEQCLLEDGAIVKKIEENNRLLSTNLDEISKIRKKKHDKS